MLEFEFSAEAVGVWVRQLVLERARSGNLSSNWREKLTAPYTPGTRDFRCDLESTLAQIRQNPPAPWEPGYAPNWQTALNRWYVESRVLMTHSYGLNTSIAVRAMTQADTLLSSCQHATELTLAHRALAAVLPVDDTADQISQAFPQVRDSLTASYMAGLAAGGVEVDWIAWLRQRIDRWPLTEAKRKQLRAYISQPLFRDALQRLPAYWTECDSTRVQL